MNRYNRNAALPIAWLVESRCTAPAGREFYGMTNAPIGRVRIGADGSAVVLYECKTAARAATIAQCLLDSGMDYVRTFPNIAWHTAPDTAAPPAPIAQPADMLDDDTIDPPAECADCERGYGPGAPCRCSD